MKGISIILLSIALSANSVSAEAIGGDDAQSHGFQPVAKFNPWADNYSDVISLKNKSQWGPYNVHDPSIRRIGDMYYCYSTDAILGDPKVMAQSGIKTGFIQMRTSRDLVNWNFAGWALDHIPAEAAEWVRGNAGGHGAYNIWAPFIRQEGKVFRLYYCVSAFGKKDSYIGLLESANPLGPWLNRGCVVKTDEGSVMNAIDPTVIDDAETNCQWMIYGSYFGGIFAVELDRITGKPLKEGDKGHRVALRANYQTDNMEAPEVIYNRHLDNYYLFTSYGPLSTTYNVRVAKGKSGDGPFIDFLGRDVNDTINAMPILTAPYRFDGHSGWAGLGHCTVFDDGNEHYFMANQGRLSPENAMMDMHVRRLFFNSAGWPMVSPERYAGEDVTNVDIEPGALEGVWEVMHITDLSSAKVNEAGQSDNGHLSDLEINKSTFTRITADDIMPAPVKTADGMIYSMRIKGQMYTDIMVFYGHDWEKHTDTLLFVCLDSQGNTFWGKKIG